MINNDEPYLVVFVGFCKMETDNKWKTATYRAVAISFYRIADEFLEYLIKHYHYF